jgi:hypothetical protein
MSKAHKLLHVGDGGGVLGSSSTMDDYKWRRRKWLQGDGWQLDFFYGIVRLRLVCGMNIPLKKWLALIENERVLNEIELE